MSQFNQTKFLDNDEFSKLIADLTRWQNDHPRNVLMLSMLLFTGARVSELLSLTQKNIFPITRSVLFYGTKGSYDRELPLSPNLFSLLAEQVLATKPGELIFPISYVQLRRIWFDYRSCNKKLHALRHTFAIRLYEKTKDLRLVQRALGHKQILNTMVYADYIYGVEEFRKVMG